MRGSWLLPVLVAGVAPIILLSLIVLGASLGLVAWRPPVLWTVQVGNPNDQSAATAVATDSAGLYVGGYLNAANSSSMGSPFLAKYDSAGAELWTQNINNSQGFMIHGMSSGAGAAFVAESLNNTIGVAKYDSNGNQIWTRQLITTFSRGVGVSSFASGVYFAGSSDRPVTNGTFTGAVEFVREYDGNGNVVWTSEFTNATSNIYAIFAGSSGVYVLTDTSLFAYDLKGNELWMHTNWTPGVTNPYSITADSTGVYVSGNQIATSPLPEEFLSKYDFNGNLVWNVGITALDGSGLDLSSISADSSGIYLSTVSSRGNGEAFKYDASSHLMWSFQTPVRPSPFFYGVPFFLVAAGSGVFDLAGSVSVNNGRGVEVLQSFSSSSSLVFFGLNPPLSFATIAVLVGGLIVGLLFMKKRYSRKTPTRRVSTFSTLKP